jgi:hypothetical protein
MTVPEGFTVDVIAAEPDLHQPIALTIDARAALGRRGVHLPRRARPKARAGRHPRVRGRDGDGSFEKRTVFLEGLNLVSGLEVGHGGVWIGAAPYLLFVPDRDDDLVPTAPRRSARRLRLRGHARDAERVHVGPRRLALRLPRRLHAQRVGKPGTPTAERVPLNAGGLALPPDAARVRGLRVGHVEPVGRRLRRPNGRRSSRPA